MDDLDEDYFWLLESTSEPDYSEYIDTKEHEETLNQRKYLIVFGIILIIFSLMGNIFVLFHIVRNPQLRKKHLLFLNLSLADILATLAVNLFMVISIWNEFNWLAGDAFCKIFICAQVLTEAGSIYAILTIILDQFQVLVKPSHPYFPKRMAILGSWLLALIPSLPHFYIAGEVSITGKANTCISIGNLSQEISNYLIYLSLIFTLYFYLPLVSGAILYTVIFIKAKPWSQLMLSSKKFKMFNLSLTLYGIALFTSVLFVIEHNVFSFSNFQVSNIAIDSWLYFVLLSRNAINPYIYVGFHFRDMFYKRTLERSNAVSLAGPCTASGPTQLTQETLPND